MSYVLFTCVTFVPVPTHSSPSDCRQIHALLGEVAPFNQRDANKTTKVRENGRLVCVFVRCLGAFVGSTRSLSTNPSQFDLIVLTRTDREKTNRFGETENITPTTSSFVSYHTEEIHFRQPIHSG